MSTFTGTFFVVTPNSIWQVTVIDLVTSPRVMRVARRDGGYRGRVPVTGIMRGYFYVAITGTRVLKYRTEKRQSASEAKIAPPLVGVKKSDRGPFTGLPVAFFLDRPAADECFADAPTAAFDPRWQSNTEHVFKEIGARHPLISIETEGEFAVPCDVCRLKLPV